MTGVVAIGVVTAWGHRDTAAQMRAADPVVGLVHLVRPQFWSTLLGPQRIAIAVIALGATAVTAVISLIHADLSPYGYAAAFVLRGFGVDLAIGWRERREDHRFLERIEAPGDDDLLYATPAELRALESGHA